MEVSCRAARLRPPPTPRPSGAPAVRSGTRLAGAEADYRPRHVVAVDDILDPLGEPDGGPLHVGESRIGEHVAERRAHRRDTQGVAGERAPDAADVHQVCGARSWPATIVCDFRRSPYAPQAMPPPIDLPTVTMSGRSPQARGAAPGSGAEGVGLVDYEDRTRLVCQASQPGRKSGLGQHDPDVGQCRFGQDGGDVAMGQCLRHSLEIVEFGPPGW